MVIIDRKRILEELLESYRNKKISDFKAMEIEELNKAFLKGKYGNLYLYDPLETDTRVIRVKLDTGMIFYSLPEGIHTKNNLTLEEFRRQGKFGLLKLNKDCTYLNYSRVKGVDWNKLDLLKPKINRRKILNSFNDIILNGDTMDRLMYNFQIDNVIRGDPLKKDGAILFGPPGSGKTLFLDSLYEFYKEIGSDSRIINLQELNSKYVGEFASNLDAEFGSASKMSKILKRPSFIGIDEGSEIVTNADIESGNLGKHYQEILDTLKRYIGNDSGVIVCITTNKTEFDSAMTREGRLEEILVDYPDGESKKSLWDLYLKKYGYRIKKDLGEVIDQLVEKQPVNSGGALINDFLGSAAFYNHVREGTGNYFPKIIEGPVNLPNPTADELTPTFETYLSRK